MLAVDALGKFVRPPPGPFTLTVPVCTSIVPLLVNGTRIVVVPLPADFLNVPLLMNVDVAPPPLEIDASTWTSNVPLLLKTAPLDNSKPPPPIQVAVPLLSSRRPFK